MIYFKFLIGFFSLFILPAIVIKGRSNNLNAHQLLCCGLVVSLVFSWCFFLLSYAFSLDDITLLITLVFIDLLLIFYIRKSWVGRLHFNEFKIKIEPLFILVFIVIASIIYTNYGSSFIIWDAVVSWNRWAIELYDNQYNPANAAYPILFPAIWSVLYKLQGNSDVWWTVKTSLYVVPIYLLLIQYYLYKELKSRIYLFSLMLSFIVVISDVAYSGYMDFPVMMLGLLSLLMLVSYHSSPSKKGRLFYLCFSILFSGLAALTKQAGLFYLILNILYISTVLKNHDKDEIKVVAQALFVTVSLIFSYLVLFYMNGDDPIGNLDKLQAGSDGENFSGKDVFESIIKLSTTYFGAFSDFHYFNYKINKEWVSNFFFGAIFSGLIFLSITLKSSYSKLCSYALLSFLLSVLIWSKYHSYDQRNAIYSYAYLIVVFSIVINGLSLKYDRLVKLISPSIMKVFFALFTFLSVLVLLPKDSEVHKIQREKQQDIGNVYMAILLSRQIKNEPDCSTIHTNFQPIKFNYLLKPYFDRVIISNSFDVMGLLSEIQSISCNGGHYLALNPWTFKVNPEAKTLLKDLEIRGVVKELVYSKMPDIYSVYRVKFN
ncbi:hypothetical protein [Dasania marina]|uniref:hypothetical protein n=1 Tax=Dasania marina TaxID=471499 RepID=UPI0030DB9FB3|tara:strand:+ start:36613 stop:38415 length:1803 start_codon:yes stop_codon:yes gene_type:complete